MAGRPTQRPSGATTMVGLVGIFVVLIMTVTVMGQPGAGGRFGVMKSSVADLRANPQAMGRPLSWGYDAQQLSQLLWQDPVEIVQEGPAGWLYVKALAQPMVYNNVWGPYEGYVESGQVYELDTAGTAFFQKVPANMAVTTQWTPVYAKPCHIDGCVPKDILVEVSFGTLLRSRRLDSNTSLPLAQEGWIEVWADDRTSGWVLAASTRPLLPDLTESQIRHLLVERAQLLLGYLYFWGGRSAFNNYQYAQETQLTGLDCSGLVGILYQSLGMIIPRDASKQALGVHNVSSAAALQIGDLFFLGDPSVPSHHVFHVMMLYSLSPPSLVESATNSTRILTIQAAFGVAFSDLQYGMTLPSGSILTWGSVLPFDPSLWRYGSSAPDS